MNDGAPLEECLDDDTIARMVGGALPAAARARVDRHLGACRACRELVAEISALDGDGRDEGEASAQRATPTQSQSAGLPPASGPRASRAAEEGLAPGDVFGRYTLRGRAGEGGMGVVYSAFDPQLHRRIALKLLRAEVVGRGDDDGAARLLREARAMARLAHPNVVTVYDAGDVDGQVFVAMEFVEGQTLGRWLRDGRRSNADVVRVFVQAAQGLAAAHGAGLVHRDFKPDNVLVDEDGRARVADFGLAHAAAVDAARTRSAADAPRFGDRAADGDTARLSGTAGPVGTPAYMAPEQWTGAPTGPATDQYSFCIALYEALYGERPFESVPSDQRLIAMLSGRPSRPSRLGDAAWVFPILARGLSPRPEDRHPSMRALIAALSRDAERRAERHLAVNVAALWAHAAMHVTLVALWTHYLLHPRPAPEPSPSPSPDPAPGGWGVLAMILGVAVILSFLVGLCVWGPLGVVWAPANAIGLRRRRPWARTSTMVYAVLSLFSLFGVPYGIYALWSLNRPNVRALFDEQA